MMSYSLQVAGRSRVVVGRTVEELSRLLPQGRVIVLTDRNVARCRPELFEGCDPICMEPGEEENIPVKGIQDKLIQYWNEYPEILQKMFQKAFLDGGRLRELRPTEADWKQLRVRMAMDYKSWFSRIFLSIASEGKWNICLSKVWKDLLPTDQWNGQDSSCRRRKALRMPDRKKSDG